MCKNLQNRKVVRYYRARREQVSEQRAVELTLARWQPTQPGHFPLCPSSIRQWHRTVAREGFAALRPKSRQSRTIHYQVPDLVVGLVFTLRSLFGWGWTPHRRRTEGARDRLDQRQNGVQAV
jgi:hypothetical protein